MEVLSLLFGLAVSGSGYFLLDKRGLLRRRVAHGIYLSYLVSSGALYVGGIIIAGLAIYSLSTP